MPGFRPRFLSVLSFYLLSTTVAQAQTVSTLMSVTPCRIIDTRDPVGSFGGPGLTTNGVRDIPVPNSSCGIPSNAVAYSVNVTVVPHGVLPYITMWPTGQAMPLASTLNSYEGKVVANAAVVPAGAGGSISVYSTGDTELIVDINGYFVNQQITIPTIPTIPTVVAQSSSGSITQNTAFGTGAASGSGAQNTALGANALASADTPSANTAIGAGALSSHTTGNDNTAVGANAMANSSNGQLNSALGSHSMESNTTGSANTALGTYALQNNATGQNNTAIGSDALKSVGSGVNNIGIGYQAGTALTTGVNNIYIGNVGVASENNVIRIGTAGTQAALFVPPVLGNAFGGGLPLVIQPVTGKIGVTTSSRRYKEDIQDIGDASSSLLQLRPVQFRYKKPEDDGSKPLQYGLIAEEVATVMPELIVRNGSGQIEGVQYQQLPALLLNELQKQHAVIERQADDMQKLLKRIEALESQTAVPASTGLAHQQ